MSEILRVVGEEILQAGEEALPYAVATVGAIGGNFLDRINRKKAQGQAEDFSGVLGSQHLQTDSAEVIQESRIDRIKKGIGVMTCVGAVAGGLVGAALSFDYKEPTNSAEPVQLIVDRTGETRTKDDAKPKETIDRIVSVMNAKFGDDVGIQVAYNGNARKMSYEELKNTIPQGTDSVAQALKAGALGAKESNVVVLAYGDKEGLPPFDEIKGDKAEEDELTVISVGGHSGSMEEYAKKSSGQYFEANPSNAEEVAENVAKSIDPKAEDGEIDFRMPFRDRLALSGLAVIGFLGARSASRRKKIIRQGNNVTQIGA
ncbi:hypothetical protein A3F37_01620 [Candidatus Saccharibacteria bacterium RIFCSPHIGHO2_12_FULL_41_12]|nr:MAG: hypothetical protein A3F37_01620 [Candidatus Saccharibacteria bacterium RIFCSPHIGHO2_12_FULL_41_12]